MNVYIVQWKCAIKMCNGQWKCTMKVCNVSKRSKQALNHKNTAFFHNCSHMQWAPNFSKWESNGDKNFSRCWTCHGRYPADLTRHNIVEICPSKYRTGKHVCRTWRTKRPAILTKLLSLMDPEAKRNLYGHYCIARNEIAISQYFQFDGTPGLCCCCQPLPGVRTVVLPEGFPPQFTVQDLQIAVQSSRVKKCAIKTNTTFLCITSQIQLCRG